MSEDIAERLWVMLDTDKNGVVDADEFTTALHCMSLARAWLRYCPNCEFGNSCDYCVEIKDCDYCTPERFCPKHWQEHPGRPES